MEEEEDNRLYSVLIPFVGRSFGNNAIIHLCFNKGVGSPWQLVSQAPFVYRRYIERMTELPPDREE